ncbi:MAG: stage V sporulation protein D [Candidatus Atribacteria bacterium]|nr:stage V sporulation protein D [Candidatus Atribacteria bacterium]MCK4308710.1 stage V sporulation protein D [Candidatus Atribacteria bacterium]
MLSKEKRERITFLFIVFIVFYFLLVYRLYNIQIVQSNKFKEIAQQEHLTSFSIEGERGNIYDRNLKKLAVNVTVQSLFAIPPKVKNPQETARKISSILNLKTKDVLDKLNQKRSFVWIKRKLTDTEVAEIKKINLDGLDFLNENKRYYPKNYLASNLLGFVGIDNQGLEGLELFFDKELKGLPGLVILERDASGGKIPLSIKEPTAHRDGKSIVLTIDEAIQYITEEALDKAFQKYKAKAGVAIVVKPKTGEILAMAVRPSYDPNYFDKFSQDLWRNRAITDVYEPGSTFKVVTIATALNERVAKLDDQFYCKGWMKYNGHIFHDIHQHGSQDLTDIVKNSCNVGVIQTGTRLDEKVFEKSIRRFGFGALTEINLPGEVNGLVRSSKDWSKISLASLSIGQEISVTPIQLIMAVSAIANRGTLMKPMIVKEILDPNQNRIKIFKPKPIRQVISVDTALTMTKILEQVVSDGTGKRANLTAYQVAGKTGTAQKFDFSIGKYSDDKYNSLFVGYVPAENPQMSILVLLDQPKGSYYGGTVAAPVFKEIASKALPYLSIPPNQ